MLLGCFWNLSDEGINPKQYSHKSYIYLKNKTLLCFLLPINNTKGINFKEANRVEETTYMLEII